MSFYLNDIFKEKLYTVPEDWEKFSSYKSPNELRFKIIVKSKGRIQQAINDDVILDETSEEDDDYISIADIEIIKKNSEVFPVFPVFQYNADG